MYSFDKTLLKYRPEITQMVEDFLDKKHTQALHYQFPQLTKQLKTYILGGKLLRGGLFITSAELLGGAINNTVIQLAATIEICHSAILIHDDIMDEDSLRRGKPTLYTQFANQISPAKITASHYGKSMALTIGDYGFFLALELLEDLAVENETKTKLTKLLVSELQQVSLAQAKDIMLRFGIKEPSEAEILQLYVHKTGRYSFGLPMTLAAIITEQTAELCSLLMQLGEQLGVIYQIKDDELSLRGSSKTTGKPRGTDIIRGNKTLHRLLLFQQATGLQKQKLKKIFGQTSDSEDNIDYVLQCMHEFSIFNLAENRVVKSRKICLEFIRSLPVSQNHQQFLLQLLEFCYNRSR